MSIDHSALETVSAAGFAAAAEEAVRRVAREQSAGVAAAADLVDEGLRAGGIVQAFGTGHSQALAMELSGRAGGLVPTNMIALRDLVLLGGEPPELLFTEYLERDPAVGRRLYDLAGVAPSDVFVMASNSGGNGSVVELAHAVKEHGHPLIVITSMAHTGRVTSRHPSGKRLFELADVVLDNGAPYGDAVLATGGVTVCAVSSITAALLAQMIVAEVVRTMLAAGETPPVYLSSNVPEGDAHNTALEARYAGRIRRPA
ncbi:putative phosphosugar-binding protein [Pseudonocardia hierapolitana]|uniref:Putative phosphosugar-binding protein n=1 Tax=Pseudonocardia hierapolitana TaxID=1128676 RepID=A0A561SQK9_9PSEU|nr:SIS domain-containing protein [Pseudonocardia hierapolitana]TWF77138.1 putative phosphosugar-binding protein [Pseudonocardia hierapolitana]